MVGRDYAIAFLASAAAIMLRAGRRVDARDLLGRALAGAPDRRAVRGIVAALATQYGTPELRDLLDLAEPAAGVLTEAL
jgi:hypothetical protein